jgi:glyoxylase-like metal-dependent hydrolase (beta-lactamase superfamily II)
MFPLAPGVSQLPSTGPSNSFLVSGGIVTGGIVTGGTLEDGDLVGELRVIHTPGHSPGHIALLHEPTGTVLVGDAVFHQAKLSLAPAGFSADPAARSAALRRIPQDVTAVGFGHGNPLTGKDISTFHEFISATG